MRVGLLTREHPPDVHCGAGVHVGFLAREPGPRTEPAVRGAARRRRAEHGFGRDTVARRIVQVYGKVLGPG